MELDGGLCIGVWERASGQRVYPTEQPEGKVRLSVRAGWTAMAFWDRSVDARRNSNAAFLIEKLATFPELLEDFRLHFPGIVKRFKFPLVYEF